MGFARALTARHGLPVGGWRSASFAQRGSRYLAILPLSEKTQVHPTEDIWGADL
jgi:hypothetical protein